MRFSGVSPVEQATPIAHFQGINLFNYGSHKRNVYVYIMLLFDGLGMKTDGFVVTDGAKVLSSTIEHQLHQQSNFREKLKENDAGNEQH